MPPHQTAIHAGTLTNLHFQVSSFSHVVQSVCNSELDQGCRLPVCHRPVQGEEPQCKVQTEINQSDVEMADVHGYTNAKKEKRI